MLGNKTTNLDDVVMKHLGKNGDVNSICTNFSKTFTEEINLIKHKCNELFLNRDDYVKQVDVTFLYNKESSNEIEQIIDKLSNRTYRTSSM